MSPGIGIAWVRGGCLGEFLEVVDGEGRIAAVEFVTHAWRQLNLNVVSYALPIVNDRG